MARPTFIRNRKPDSDSERDRRSLDLPADGRFWIDPTRGTVVRSEVRLRTGWSEATATFTTRYRPEPRLAMWVPDEMKERYEIRGSSGTGSFAYGPQGGREPARGRRPLLAHAPVRGDDQREGARALTPRVPPAERGTRGMRRSSSVVRCPFPLFIRFRPKALAVVPS